MNTDTVTKTCIKLLLREPFYGHYISGVPKQMSDSVPTAAVSLHENELFKLSVNPDFWEKLSQPHRYGLIKHEVLHLVFRHLLRYREFSNKQLFNIAADLAINQYIDRDQLPAGGITLRRFTYLENYYGIKLLPGKDVGYYYRRLDGILKKDPQPTPGGGGAGGGSFGKGAETQQDGDDDLTPDALRRILQNGNAETERHKLWRDSEKLTPGEVQILEKQAQSILKNAAQRIENSPQGYGKLPVGLIEQIKDLIKSAEPKVDWRRVLRIFAASGTSTFVKNTLRRPSKRYGTTPGGKLRRRQKLLVAIDTSGSVSLPDFKEFFAEIHHIYKRGAEITVVECDTEIHKIYPYKGKLPTEIKGRGGTDFNAPIEFANTKLRPDALLYFTDGFAPPPALRSRCPILWVISERGIAEGGKDWTGLPGRKVRIL